MNELQTARAEIAAADRGLAIQFERRMRAVKAVADYKKAQRLPISDPAQEQAVLDRGAAMIEDPVLRPYFIYLLKDAMRYARHYQRQLLQEVSSAARLTVSLPGGDYDVILEHGCLQRAGDLLDLNRRVLIVTDDGVPAAYVNAIAAPCAAPLVISVPQGERSKSLQTVEQLLTAMLRAGFTRRDCVVAVGGGMVCDLAGFAASIYMRGIAYATVPTTVLAQADASIGGKTAVNLDGIKNAVGAFHQPQRVLIDPETLATLPPRQAAGGLAEILKVALTSDPALLALFERDPLPPIEQLLIRALRIKADVVMRDEKEQGLRKLLNFGHTIGHAIESVSGGSLHHGECVALGMLPLCSPEIRARLLPIYCRLGLPMQINLPLAPLMNALSHDKKADGETLTVVTVPEPGRYEFKTMEPEALLPLLSVIIKEGTQ